MRKVAVLALVLGVSFVCRAEDKKADAPKLEGTYKLVAGKKNGEAVGDDAKKSNLVVTDKKMTLGNADGKFVFLYKVDGKNIDLEIEEAPFEGLKGTKAYGILELKDGTLKLAYATEKDKRPKDYEGKEGFYFEMKKEKDKK